MNSSSDINLRLVTLVQHFSKGNAAAFARSIHVAQQRFDRLLKPDKKNGNYPMVKYEMTDAILDKYPSVQSDWLFSGKGTMINTVDDPPSAYVHQLGVPYYALDFIHEYDLIQSRVAESIHSYFDIKIFNQADFWCHVSGRSMEPDLAPGDIVAMKEVSGKEAGIVYGEIYGIVTNNFCIVRRAAKGTNRRYLKLIPSNKSTEYAEQEQEIPFTCIERIYKVMCCIKKM